MTVVVARGICLACELYRRDYRCPSKTALFYHLLWHRDAGHVVPREMLDECDPDLSDPKPPPVGRANWGHSESALANSYGDHPNSMIRPDRFGRVRGRVGRKPLKPGVRSSD